MNLLDWYRALWADTDEGDLVVFTPEELEELRNSD